MKVNEEPDHHLIDKIIVDTGDSFTVTRGTKNLGILFNHQGWMHYLKAMNTSTTLDMFIPRATPFYCCYDDWLRCGDLTDAVIFYVTSLSLFYVVQQQ